jgi:hypothetical protein
MIWEDADRADWAVAKCGTWVRIRDVRRLFPSAAGVFVFADDHHEVRYVGQARWPRLGVEARGAVYRAKDHLATQALWLVTESDAEAFELAARLRQKYHPPNHCLDGLDPIAAAVPTRLRLATTRLGHS